MTTIEVAPEFAEVGDHHIEEVATVYLRLSADGKHWEVDSPSNDGCPLEGYPNGHLHEECDCRDVTKDGDVMDLGRDLWKQLPSLPTLPELHRIIGEYLYPTGRAEEH